MSNEITHDSISLGWNGDSHERQLFLIQDGKIIHTSKKNDRQIAGGRVVVEHDLIDWAKDTIKKNGYQGEYVFKPSPEWMK